MTAFDKAAWRERLLELNLWARSHTIGATNVEFEAARQKATLARYEEGKEVWNGWADQLISSLRL